MKRIVATGFFLLCTALSAWACKCAAIGKLSKPIVEQYDIIFTGKVSAISGDEQEQRVQFTISELFKGTAYQTIELKHNPSTDCSFSFAPGETWTIYGQWLEYDIVNRRGVPTTNFCTHTRRAPVTPADDFQTEERGNYATELKFLRDSIGVQPFTDPSAQQNKLHQNEHPGPATAIGYLLAGLGGLAIIFFFVRRMFKRDGK